MDSESGFNGSDAERNESIEPSPRVVVEDEYMSDDLAHDVKNYLKWQQEEALKPILGDLSTPVHREVGGKKLYYTVINGEQLRTLRADLFREYETTYRQAAERHWGGPLVTLPDKIGLNINVVGPGEQQSFHVDRNEVTVLVYLTATVGGALEYLDPETGTARREAAHRSKKITLVGAHKIRHRVLPVEAGEQRITLVLSYGLAGKNYVDPDRDDFLYTSEKEVPNQKVFDDEP